MKLPWNKCIGPKPCMSQSGGTLCLRGHCLFKSQQVCATVLPPPPPPPPPFQHLDALFATQIWPCLPFYSQFERPHLQHENDLFVPQIDQIYHCIQILLVCDLNRTPNCYGKTWRFLCPFFRNLHLRENLARDCFTSTVSIVTNSGCAKYLYPSTLLW